SELIPASLSCWSTNLLWSINTPFSYYYTFAGSSSPNITSMHERFYTLDCESGIVRMKENMAGLTKNEQQVYDFLKKTGVGVLATSYRKAPHAVVIFFSVNDDLSVS